MITLEQQIAEVQREISMRKAVYPKRVAAGSMSREESDLQIETMKAALATLKGLAKQDKPDPMHNRCMALYIEWYTGQVGVPPKLTGRDGLALKNILKYLRQVIKDKSDEGLVSSWNFILNNYDRTGFFRNQKGLATIDKNISEILDKIRNGASKNDSTDRTIEQKRLDIERRRQNPQGPGEGGEPQGDNR